MKLLLMRHADADAVNPWAYPDDDLRPLSELGTSVQQDMARALKRLNIMPDRIITSPRVRTLQTAQITAKVLSLEHALAESDVLGRGYSVAAVLKLLAAVPAQETVLCVGHEPDLHELSGALLGMASGPGIKFPKSGIMRIDFYSFPKAGAGSLRFFYRPRDLLALL